MNNNIILISTEEQKLRLSGLNLECPALVCDNAGIFYLTGRIFAGYIYIEPGEEPRYFVKRPTVLTGAAVTYIRKPEEILAHLSGAPERIALEAGSLPYADVMRLKAALAAKEIVDLSGHMMLARSVKTPTEIEMLRRDGVRQSAVYERIPKLFRPGMTDIELQAAIEYDARLAGCLGIFRVNGPSMEIHMGSVLTGDNADEPSPYDFAMGGAGLDPSLPVGACGEEIKPGRAVMVDMNGNFNGYMTDMTRMYANGKLPDEAVRAHECSVEICHALAALGTPGTEARVLYEKAVEIAQLRGLETCFMGRRYHAGFVGHGVGIQINELPVLAPRSRACLQAGNVIAIEPKFVIQGFGAVGIENTYVCTSCGLERITPAPEEIVSLI